MAWHKTSSTERGYGAEWAKTRKRILMRDCGLCQVCAKQGRVTMAQEVDHIRSKARGGTGDDDNLQAICTPCHKAKTATETGKTLRPRVTISLDGWPVKG